MCGDDDRDAHVAEDWFKSAFNDFYPVVYAHRTANAAAPEAAFALRCLDIQSGERVLDLCCGDGRHLAHLLKRTSRVVGLDYSRGLLQQAARATSGSAALVRADMRDIPFAGVFDAVVNFFTSFGYFVTREENARVARSIAQALKPGGRFLIDYLNDQYVKRTLVPHSVRVTEGYEVHERRWINAEDQRINKITRVRKEGCAVREMSESVQLYTPDEFGELLQRGGLRVDHFWGDYAGAPLSEACPRMIAVGHRG